MIRDKINTTPRWPWCNLEVGQSDHQTDLSYLLFILFISIKRTSERQEMPLVGGFGCPELVLNNIRDLA